MSLSSTAAILLFLAISKSCHAQTTTCDTTFDVMFLFDGSNTIQRSYYNRTVANFRRIYLNATLSSNGSRIGAICFGYPADPPFVPLRTSTAQFDQEFTSKCMSWPDGTTESHVAMLRAIVELRNNKRADVPQFIVFVSDGDHNSPQDAMTAYNIAVNSGITVLTVAHGPWIKQNGLNQISSKEANGSARSYTDLQSAWNRMTDLATVCRANCTNGVVMMIIADGSNSVNHKTFNSLLSAIVNASIGILDQFSNSLVGCVIYSSTVTEVFPPTNNRTMLNRILNATYPDGSTNTAEGIRAGQQELTRIKKSGIPQAMVIITDGESDNPPATLQTAADSKGLGTLIASVGVGPLIDEEETKAMASTEANYYRFANYTQLIKALSDLVPQLCTESTSPPPGETTPTPTAGPLPTTGPFCEKTLDVIFVVDCSDKVGADNFETMRSALNQTAQYFVGGVNSNNSKVGVITYSTNVITDTGLLTKDAVNNGIQSLQYVNGSRDTAEALYEAARKVLDEKSPDRHLAVVVLIAGRSDNPGASVGNANFLVSQSGGSIYVLEITDAVDTTETAAMAGTNDPAGRIRADAFRQVPSQLATLAAYICQRA